MPRSAAPAARERGGNGRGTPAARSPAPRQDGTSTSADGRVGGEVYSTIRLAPVARALGRRAATARRRPKHAPAAIFFFKEEGMVFFIFIFFYKEGMVFVGKPAARRPGRFSPPTHIR